jgi:hypothetical protein
MSGETPAQRQASAAEDQAKIAQQQLELEQKREKQNAKSTLLGYERGLYDIDSEIEQLGIDSRATARQIQSYDDWLAGYQDMYDLQTGAKEAEITAFKAAGQESYENFLNAIGYADAQAAARGHVGAGTSAQAVTGALDKKLTDYVGEDRTLDENGGLYGLQLGVQEKDMLALIADLEAQKTEISENRGVAQESLGITDAAIARAGEEKGKIRKEMDDLQAFIDGL